MRPFIRLAVNGRFIESVLELDKPMSSGDEVIVMEFITLFGGG